MRQAIYADPDDDDDFEDDNECTRCGEDLDECECDDDLDDDDDTWDAHAADR